MDTRLDALIASLQEQTDHHRKILELSKEKQQVIIQNDITRLEEIISLEKALMKESAAINKRREQDAEALASELNIPGDELTVSNIIAHKGEDAGHKLNHLRRELGLILNTQKTLNESNMALLKAQIEYTDTMLNIIVGAEDPLNNFYGSEGAKDKGRRMTPGIFDTKI